MTAEDLRLYLVLSATVVPAVGIGVTLAVAVWRRYEYERACLTDRILDAWWRGVDRIRGAR